MPVYLMTLSIGYAHVGAVKKCEYDTEEYFSLEEWEAFSNEEKEEILEGYAKEALMQYVELYWQEKD